MAFKAKSVRVLLITICLMTFASVIRSQVDKSQILRPNRDDKTAFGSIRGRVILPDGNYVNTNVRVTLQTLRETINTIFTDSQGQFEFSDLIPGNYQVQADPTDRNNFDVTTEFVQVFRGVPSILSLTLKKHEAKKSTDKVSAVSIS